MVQYPPCRPSIHPSNAPCSNAPARPLARCATRSMEVVLDGNDVLALVPSPAEVVAHVTAILEHFAALTMSLPRFITSPRLQVRSDRCNLLAAVCGMGVPACT